MTPPKVGFLRANKVLSVQKKLRGPHKNEKNCFSQKGPIHIFPNHTILSLWTICGPLALEFVLSIHFDFFVHEARGVD